MGKLQTCAKKGAATQVKTVFFRNGALAAAQKRQQLIASGHTTADEIDARLAKKADGPEVLVGIAAIEIGLKKRLPALKQAVKDMTPKVLAFIDNPAEADIDAYNVRVEATWAALKKNEGLLFGIFGQIVQWEMQKIGKGGLDDCSWRCKLLGNCSASIAQAAKQMPLAETLQNWQPPASAMVTQGELRIHAA